MNYENIYNRLIARAEARKESKDLYEMHMVLPKCLGGRNVDENIVYLTSKEHYLAHLLLVKMNPSSINLLFEVHMMTRENTRYTRSNKEYSWIKKRKSLMISQWLSGKKRGPYRKSKGKDAYSVAVEIEMFKEILDNFKKTHADLVYLPEQDVQKILNLLNEYTK
jgi:hypothetical protein